jgi:integrase
MFALHGDAVAFPERLFKPFLADGIGGATDRRVVVRNQLIVLMMHYAGCRLSDALHLWIHDVHVDPFDESNVILRLYHPENGKAPDDWKARNGTTTRAAYLREQWGLTPRNRLTGTGRVGWKSRVIDHRDKYIQLHWFPSGAGRIFAQLWQEYLRYLAYSDRSHPYAFVSFGARTRGTPLTINSFNDAYVKALHRIGEKPSKAEGRSPHAHRHAMGRRMERARIPARVIQKVLHHKSIASQAPYTVPGIDRITQILNEGSATLQNTDPAGAASTELSKWDDLIKHGFNDIDPLGLYSGIDPLFRNENQ